jgi:hypothetical protein
VRSGAVPHVGLRNRELDCRLAHAAHLRRVDEPAPVRCADHDPVELPVAMAQHLLDLADRRAEPVLNQGPPLDFIECRSMGPYDP